MQGLVTSIVTIDRHRFISFVFSLYPQKLLKGGVEKWKTSNAEKANKPWARNFEKQKLQRCWYIFCEAIVFFFLNEIYTRYTTADVIKMENRMKNSAIMILLSHFARFVSFTMCVQFMVSSRRFIKVLRLRNSACNVERQKPTSKVAAAATQ